ncbi:hypothetical protein [Lelliottia nimipressuralis]|uniref:Lipoprotein n=1 Tax=Lelliottia nimipressuralis TaxID=69220 RepID=A0ABD4K5P5_9ENTR|nr:hypothetical protein [Lelliottia nimipressuralis]MBF4176857.1 hypothetical protein [Lelliottia nimipressuralis]
MLKPILASAVLTLSGCAIIQEPPKHGTPDAVYTTKSDTKSVAFCIADVFADYDPFILASYKKEFWGYKVTYSAEPYGEAEIYRKNNVTIVNYFEQNNSDKKMVKHLKDGIQKCVTTVYDMTPVGGKQPDGSVKLW